MTKNQTQHKEKVTEKEYSSFQYAYDYFNKHLFEGKLPQCLMTLQRQANAKGYFHAENFRARNDGSKVDEIALNPDTFGGRSDEDILSTLVHEMCHLWNHHFGKPSKPSYHNKSWVKKMLEIGLKPVSLDYPDSMVGQRVTHEIIPNGLFQKVTQQLLKTNFKLNWQSGYLFEFPFPIDFPIDLSSLKLTHKSLFTSIKKKDPSKVKFSCSSCGQNAWLSFLLVFFVVTAKKKCLLKINLTLKIRKTATMFSYLDSGYLEGVLQRYYHIESLGEHWQEDLKRELRVPKFPKREKEFRHQLAYAIINQTISPSQYEKLTDLELETDEEVAQELTELWMHLYSDEPVSLETL